MMRATRGVGKHSPEAEVVVSGVCAVGNLEAEAYAAACMCTVWVEGGMRKWGLEAEVVSGRVCAVCATEGVGRK